MLQSQDKAEIYKKICKIYFLASRSYSYNTLNAFSKIYGNIFKVLQNHPEKIYMEVLLLLLCHTRDIRYGKGQRDITYMMLIHWYKYNPTLTLKVIQNLLTYHYGCWSDIKYFCNYVAYDEVVLSFNEKESLVNSCVDILIYQFDMDNTIWNNAMNNYEINRKKTITPRPNARECISNVSKWIPRESKKYSWIYERIVYRYNMIHNPYVFKNENIEIVMTKCKTNFRKKMTKLNKELETTEIYACSNKWAEIKADNVPMQCIMQNKDAFTNDENETRVESTNEFKQYFYENSNTHSCVPTASQTSIGEYVKHGLRLLNKPQYDNICAQREWLNRSWRTLIKMVKNKNEPKNVLPIIDMSIYLSENGRHNAIGIAILLAQASENIGRIVASSNMMKSIEITTSMDFMDALKAVNDHYKKHKHYTFQLQKTMNMLFNGKHLIEENVMFTVLSSSSQIKKYQDSCFTTQNKYIYIAFWNVCMDSEIIDEKDELIEIDKNALYLSGSNPYFVKNLFEKRFSIHTFDYMYNMLNGKRYELFSEIFKNTIR